MILLLSGGMDSIAMWRMLGLPQAVNFDLGTKPQPREQQALDWAQFRFGKTYMKRPLPMGEHETANGYLPFRNGLLILAAAQIDPLVCIGQIAEWAPDKNYRFYRRLERTMNVPGQLADFDKRLRITAPYGHLSKGELIALYHKAFGPVETRELLRNTWSCYGDGDIHCGHCGGCVQRWNAEAHYNKIVGMTPYLGGPVECRLFTKYEVEPPFVLTPNKDKARWIRDNGYYGVQQIWKRHQQNKSAKELHATSGPDLQPPIPFRQRSHQR